jgi:hypothetical protein
MSPARALLVLHMIVSLAASAAPPKEPRFDDPIDVNVPPIGSDPSVRYDYDIVYCRAQRAGDTEHKRFWTEIATPVYMQPRVDLMLLHPDGSEEVLVAGGEKGAITDPVVSFDGQWVYYAHLYDVSRGGQHDIPPGGADIFKIHVKTRQIVKLTDQQFTPNTGAASFGSDFRKPEKGKNHFPYGVYNMGPCPLPGGRVMYTSNRNGFRPPKHPAPCLQLFVMDDDGRNVEQVGHLNVGMALHPTVLVDGRVMWSSLESQGLRNGLEWGLWISNPDGTDWQSILAALRPGGGANDAFHFQTQLSDGSIIAEEYYNQNNSGFGTYYKLPPPPAVGYAMGPADPKDPRNPKLRVGRFDNGRPQYTSIAFSPEGIESFTPFTHPHDGPANRSVRGDKNSPAVGKFTHPVHPPVGRARQPPADRLLPRPGQPPVHVQPPDRRRHLPDQVRQADRRARRDAADQERPELQRAVAARGRAVPAHLRRRRAEADPAAEERRQGLAPPAGGHAVRTRRNFVVLQARDVPQGRRAQG